MSATAHSHAVAATAFLADPAPARRHDQGVWFVRAKRDAAVDQVPDWEALRTQAAAIKDHALGDLATYLERFEAAATAAGAVVHWAPTAEDHNRIVLELLQTRGVRRLVKSKSMLTEECGLNPHLEAHGIEITDTDLGEWIVQLRQEPPSHIVMPAIHLDRKQIGDTFHRAVGSAKGADDPEYLTGVAREALRQRFLAADAGLTGVNFAVAETGSVVVCTNEGNADLGTGLPPLHVACMGIEKIVPRAEDLGVFTRLLARSATGQAITTYTSHFTGPKPGGELHIVIVDNGRSDQLARGEFRRSLRCIRCAACMNTCPVYRRSGGHSYGTTVPGPIGSVLAPGRDPNAHADLPFASTLCGSCSAVCPVGIDLHHQLLAWRQRLVAAGRPGTGGWAKRRLAAIAGRLMASPRLWRAALRLAPTLRRIARLPGLRRLDAWQRERELPPMPKERFRDWHRNHGS